jgi:hypothetical protein
MEMVHSKTAVETLGEVHILTPETLMKVALTGEMNGLSQSQLMQVYLEKCYRVGLDPATYPFQLLELNSKLIWYATKACAHGLTKKHGLSVTCITQDIKEDGAVVMYRCSGPGIGGEMRDCDDIGVVDLTGLKGERRSNAIMKAHTKAKRRAVLSWSGLGESDEEELASIPGAKVVPFTTTEPVELSGMARAKVEEMLEMMRSMYLSASVDAAYDRLKLKLAAASTSGECDEIVDEAYGAVKVAWDKKHPPPAALPEPHKLDYPGVQAALQAIALNTLEPTDNEFQSLLERVYDEMYRPAVERTTGPRHEAHWQASRRKHTTVSAKGYKFCILRLAEEAERLNAEGTPAPDGGSTDD